MNKHKRKILAISERVESKTGFSKYYKEILSRLHATDKFEIADLSCYSIIDDPNLFSIPWKLYCNTVSPQDPRFKEYQSSPENIWGRWRFDKTLLDFRPDITLSCRDLWFDSYILKSPLRRFFHFAYMPTTDSSPVRPEWIEDIIEADAIFAYNDWALEIMREESGGKANIIKSAPPGIDPTIFFPAPNKIEQKKKMMLKPDIYLIGMFSRNQKRKLFPDLFIGFEKFLNLCYEKGNKELAQKTNLFIHTSYPDAGWNIPLLLKERNISHKVLFSYICRNCKKWFPAYYSDAKTICPFCDGVAVMPNVELGVDENQLAEIYRCLDLYSHLAIAGGFEMCIVEAAGCGVPCMASENTSMIDVIKKVNGLPLKLAHTFRELETGAYRHYTDIDYMVQKWYQFFTVPNEYRKVQEELARQGVLDNYTWDKTAKIWEDYLENCELKGLQGKWNSPPEFIQPRIRTDFNELSNKDFVRYLILDILQRPSELYKLRTLHLLSVLNYGAEVDGRKIRQIKREEIHNAYINMVKNHNYCEEIRCGLRPLPREDFIEYANMRMDS